MRERRVEVQRGVAVPGQEELAQHGADAVGQGGVVTLPDPLGDTAARCLRVLLARQHATRPELAEALGVTKQTVSAGMAELEERGLVEAVDVQQGRTGRSAVRYALH